MEKLEDVRFKCVIPNKRIGKALYAACGGESALFNKCDNAFFQFNGRNMEKHAHSSRQAFHLCEHPIMQAEDALKWLCRVSE